MGPLSLPLVFRRVARSEYVAAGDWYEARSAGLGATFTAAVQRVLDTVADRPGLYAVVAADIREAIVPGFPYCVYYREEPARLLVLAVSHTARDPAIWQGRA